MILNRIGKMSLVDDREHVVTSGDAVGHKAGVLEHEDMILGIRNDRGLVLRYLHHGQTLEVDNGIRHCRDSKFNSDELPQTGIFGKIKTTYIHVSHCKCAPTSCGMGNLGNVPVL